MSRFRQSEKKMRSMRGRVREESRGDESSRGPATALRPEHLRVLRPGHGANCSSIGSVVDTLFVTALAGGAIYAAVMAALASEPVRSVAAPSPGPAPAPEPASEPEDEAG
jgi:hypothetical protein